MRYPLLAALILLTTPIMLSPAVAADPAPTPVIAVLNVEAVERGSVAWDSLREQIDGRRNTLQKEVEALQSKLEKKARAIEAQRAILSEEAFTEKVREFEQERGQLQQETNARKQALDRAYASARSQIRDALNKVVAKIADERGFNLVLNASVQSSGLYYMRKELLIDNDVLAALNKEIKTVTVPNDAKGAAPGA